MYSNDESRDSKWNGSLPKTAIAQRNFLSHLFMPNFGMLLQTHTHRHTHRCKCKCMYHFILFHLWTATNFASLKRTKQHSHLFQNLNWSSFSVVVGWAEPKPAHVNYTPYLSIRIITLFQMINMRLICDIPYEIVISNFIPRGSI